jgi:hypothetical protein
VESVGGEFEAWQQAQDKEAMEVRNQPAGSNGVHDLAGWVADVLEVTGGARRLLLEAERTGVPSGDDGPVRFGEAGLRLLDAAMTLLEVVGRKVEAARANGLAVEGEERLRATIREVAEERTHFIRRWPTDRQRWDRATADIKAGRIRTLQETRDELRRRRSG